MDSQQAAFEKFKSSGAGRGGRSSEGMSSNRRGDDGPMPDLYSIHNGKVVRVEGSYQHSLRRRPVSWVAKKYYEYNAIA